MPVTPSQRQLWQQRLQAEAAVVAQRQVAARRLAQAAVCLQDAAFEPGGIAVDLVRLEALDPHWQQRIRARAEPLLAPTA